MWQIPQKLSNDHLTNNIVQKVMTKFVNSCSAYVKMKKKKEEKKSNVIASMP